MGAAQFRDGDGIFLVRVGGVAISDDRVLLHRTEGEDYWSLPGGRLEVGETAADALIREMAEEIDADVEVDGMLWMIQNFFEHPSMDNRGSGHDPVGHHEIGLYMAMGLPRRFETVESFWGTESAGTEWEFRMEFRWFLLADLAGVDIRPAVLQHKLCEALPVPHPELIQRS